MKKRIITIMTATLLLLGTSIQPKALTALDIKYKEAYDRTMNVVNIGAEYNVKPFYKQGSSDDLDVTNAVSHGNLQKEILSAREALDELPGSIQILKNTLSSILDDYQHPIYETIVKSVDKANECTTEDITSINENTNLVGTLVANQQIQWKITQGRELIKDVPQPFKSSYSSALDQCKQRVLNSYWNLVVLTEKTKNESLKNFTLQLLNNERDLYENGDDVKNFVNSLLNKTNNVKVTPALSQNDMTSFALTNGFTKEADLSKLPNGMSELKNQEGFKAALVKNSKENQLAFVMMNDEAFLYSKNCNLDGALDFVKNLSPVDGEKLIATVKQKQNKCFVLSNGLWGICAYNKEGDFSLIRIVKF